MRQMFLLLSVLLLGLSWSLAQNSTPSANSSTAAGQTSHASASRETSVEGCLSGSNGSYTLTDKNGVAYQLTGDTAKLGEHVGHEVRITGTRNSASSNAGGGGASSPAGSAGSEMLQVSSVKHISKTCKSATGMSH
jgi:Protein of unknown function (DUF5818)